MKLKSLTINGFKSFADKTEIDFQPGITGIVGPNGSGKSNIIESLRWVLGEQSAKSLRGSKMPDVIFAGSATRAPLNRAEVEIEFDNSDRFLPDQPDELRITRRIYRSGESEFLLNGKKVRLKDIINLFMDTGLGKESFSVISQGRVESIFNSKPEDRRVLIEETAGVLKYKKEKERAEKELKETTDHLDRVVDILTELKRQREPLEEQASIAKDYVEQKKQFDYYHLNELVLEIQQGRKQKAELDQQLKQAKELLAKYKQAALDQEEHTTQLHEQQQTIENQLDQVQAQLVTLTQQRERLAGKKDISEQQRQFQIEKIESLTKQINENQYDRATLQEKLATVQKRLDELKGEKQKLQHQIKSLSADQKLAPEELERAIAEITDQINQQTQQKMQAENEIQVLEQSETQRQSELNKVQDQLATVQAAAQPLEDQLTAVKAQTTECQANLEKTERQAEKYREKRTKLNAQIDQQRQSWYQASEIMQKAQARLEALESVAHNYSGYYQGVREILKQRNQLQGIVGSVAEAITVDQQYSQAIETTLGSQLQNIIVKDENAAKAGIRFLTQKRLGRATFLPQTTMRARSIDSRLLQQARNDAGMIGIASDLVTFDASNRNVIQYLLGTTLIVKDIDAATRIARAVNHRVKLVTLKGEVVNPGGSMTGGANRTQRNGLLQKKQESTVLKEQLKTMQTKLSGLEEHGKQLKRQLADVITKDQKNATQVNDLHQQLTTMQKNLAAIQQQFDEQHHRQEQLQRQLQDLDGTKAAARQTELKKQVESLTASIAELQTELDDKKRFSEDVRSTQRASSAKLNEFKQQLMLVNERLTNAQLQANEYQTQINQLNRALDQGKQSLERIQSQQSLNDMHGDELTKKQAEIEKQHAEYTAKVNQMRTQRDELHDQVADAESRLRRANELQQASNDDQRKASLQLGRLTSKLEQHLQELIDTYEMTFEKAVQEAQETDLNEVQRHLKLLKRGIDELGEVNLGAIDEFERVNERFEFLNTQQMDLNNAKETLVQSMDEMDNEVKTRFKETFDQVATAFASLFPQIFGGGKAYLTLTASDDLLHTGIEITAQPPGKKAQRLSLLSGGERSLTAITLLFALLKVRPVPFAVLDEAEAALDDANVARYSQYLKNFDDETQFIVITHRKGTMMQADVLYGVTMQESGVSKMVSVSLADVI